MRTRNPGAILGMALAIAGTVFAHHSFSAEYDLKKPVKLEGKVTEMKWSNPHSWIYIDVETNGKVVNWALETGAANALTRRGWKKGDLPAGTELKVEGWAARNGSPARCSGTRRSCSRASRRPSSSWPACSARRTTAGSASTTSSSRPTSD